MNKFLPMMAAALAMSSFFPADAQVISVNRATANPHAASPIMKSPVAGSFMQNSSTRSDDEEDMVTISPKLTWSAGEQFSFIVAVTRDGEGNVLAYGSDDPYEGFEMTVPKGTYDIVAMGDCEGLDGTFVLSLSNVVVDGTESVVFNTADATYHTDIMRIGPSGEELHIPTEAEPNRGNCSSGDIRTFITYDNTVIAVSTVFCFYDAQYYIKSNNPESNFRVTRLAFMGAKDGMCYMVVPMDFSKSEVSTDISGWQSAEYTFTPTAVNRKYDELIAPTLDEPYTCSSFAIQACGKVFTTGALGVYGEGYNAAKICMWAPADYDNTFEYVAFPMGDVLFGEDSAVKARPVRRSAEGLRQQSLNIDQHTQFWYTADNSSVNNGNPTISPVPEGVAMGNSCPVQVFLTDYGLPLYNYLGRYGEAITMDQYSLYKNLDEERMALVGGSTNEICAKRNGDVVQDQRIDFPDDVDWEEEGDWEFTVDMRNVLVDGEYEGYNKSVVTYNIPNFDNKMPTVTYLQIQNGNTQEITDHFSSMADKPILAFYAARVGFEYSNAISNVYMAMEEPASVTAEWAPAGSENFVPLNVVNIPERNFFPGFGYYYEADLSTIDRESENWWYALRLTVTDTAGSQQQQVMTPAFSIASLSGIEDVNSTPVSSTARYYNLQGQPIKTPDPGEIVIRQTGSKTEKIIVR